MFWIQQEPFVVDVIKQPPPAQDISISVVLGMFAMAGVLLLVAAVGGLIAGGILVAIRRYRDSTRPPVDTEHLRLRI